MKAVRIHEHGGREVLLYEEVPTPRPGLGEVLIEVHAVSVNRSLDLGVRDGSYGGPKPELPAILGVDPSGVVVEVGEGVDRLKPGDRVTDGASGGQRRTGGYAQYAIARQHIPIIPDRLSFAEATVVARHFPTGYSEIRRSGLKAGEWILVMGAAGGLGSCALQIAKHLGAKVIAAAGADERVQAAVELGADFGINYRTQDLAATVRELTSGHGVDVVLENIADPDLWPGAFNSLARNGRLMTVGAHGGGTVSVDMERLYQQRLTIMHGMGGNDANDELEALALAATGEYRVLIDCILPLSQVIEAHRLVEEENVLGKVILDPSLDRKD